MQDRFLLTIEFFFSQFYLTLEFSSYVLIRHQIQSIFTYLFFPNYYFEKRKIAENINFRATIQNSPRPITLGTAKVPTPYNPYKVRIQASLSERLKNVVAANGPI